MHSEYDKAIASVASLQAMDEIRDNETLAEYLVRMNGRTIEDVVVDDYIHSIRKRMIMAADCFRADDIAMGQFWESRVFQLYQRLMKYKPISVEFLASAPASAGERPGQQSRAAG